MSLMPSLCALLLLGQASDLTNERLREVEKRCGGAPGDVRRALAILKRMEQQAVEQKKEDWGLYARWRRGWCESRLGDFAEARKTYEQALDGAPQGHGIRYFLDRDLGELCLRCWDLPAAKRHLDRAQARARASKRAPVKLFGQAIPLARSEFIRLRIMSAEVLLNQGKNKEARRDFLAIEKDITARVAEAAGKRLPPDWVDLPVECQCKLADLDRRRGEPIRAVERLIWCLEDLGPRATPTSLQMQFGAHIGLALNCRLLAQFREAQAHLDEAAKVLPRIPGERNEADLDGTRAGLLLEQAAFALAADEVGRGTFARLARAEKLAGSALNRLSRLARAGGGKADLFTANMVDHLAQVHELRARAFVLTGAPKMAAAELARAARRADEAVELFTSLLAPDHDLVLAARRRRAWLSLRRGQPEAARKEAREAFALFAKNHPEDDVGRGDFHHLLLEAEDACGNRKAAAGHALAHRRLSARRLVPYLAGLTAAEQVRFFRMWDDPGLHASLRLALRHKDDEKLRELSVECLLNGKAKIAEVMGHLNRGRRGDPAHAAVQAALKRQACLLFGRPEADPKALARALLAEDVLLQKLHREAAKKGASFPEHWYTLEEARKGLAPGEVYVDVFRLRPDERSARAYYAWVVPATGPVHVVELGGADAIDRLANRLVEEQEQLARDRTGKDFSRPFFTKGMRKLEEELRRDQLVPLSKLLLTPELLRLCGTSKRWVVGPDGPLWHVPWGALILPKTGAYAVEEITFRYVVSGRDLAPRPEGKVERGEPLVVADPDVDAAPVIGKWLPRPKGARLGRLPGAGREGEKVAEALERLGPKPRLREGRVTKRALLGLKRSPRVLYLATHGFSALPAGAQVNDPLLGCGIALSGYNHVPAGPLEEGGALPGLLTGAEVLAAELGGTELVVLSACQSGTGQALPGQSPADLRHAFHLAGARSVVSTLWSVDDRRTQELMVDFVSPLAARDLADRPAALSEAQRKMIRKLRKEKRERHAHPFYWAAFTLSGP